MLYFYCIEGLAPKGPDGSLELFRTSGSVQCHKRLETPEELQAVQKSILQAVFSDIQKNYPDFSFDDANFGFSTFNPL